MTGRHNDQNQIVREWVEMAKEDLSVARELSEGPGAHLRVICFHSQQAVEKFLKAYLAYLGIPFDKTHVIENLVNLLPEPAASSLRLHDILDLTEYAVDTRYPSVLPADIDDNDARRALDAARTVSEFVLKSIKL